MINTLTEITWAYLQILERCKIPLTIIAIGIFGMMMRAQLVLHRPPAKWLVILNFGILLQFAVMLLAWIVVAILFDRNYYYFIFNFFLITWTALPFLLLACVFPLLSRQAART